jgi:CDP-diacylglycerol---serine O-phosphatidyltransferase
MKNHLPNLITCLNAFTGSVGCFLVAQGFTEYAIYMVAIAGLFDLLDGMVARLLNVQSDMGKELDSLADMVSFGLLPGLVMMQLIMEVEDTYFWAGLLIVPFSAWRLAKFNLSTDQSDSFLGLPTPANALMISSLFMLRPLFQQNPWLLFVITGISCFLLVSNLRLLAMKFKTWGWEGNEARWLLQVGILAGFVLLRQGFLPFLIPFYIIWSLIGNGVWPKRVS